MPQMFPLPNWYRYTGGQDMNGDGQVNDADAFPGPAPLLAGKLGILYSRLCTALPTYTFITHDTSTPARRSPFPFSTSRAPSALEEEPPVEILPSPDPRLTPPGGKVRAPIENSTTPNGQKRTSMTGVSTPLAQPSSPGGRLTAPGSPSGRSTPERDPPVPSAGTEAMGVEEPAIVGESVVSRFVGTALVLGYLDAWGVLTSAECANYVSLAAAYFQQQGLLVAGDTSEVHTAVIGVVGRSGTRMLPEQRRKRDDRKTNLCYPSTRQLKTSPEFISFPTIV